MNKRLSDEQLEWAKAQYMDYTPVTKIASKLGVRKNTVQYHVDKGWRSERTLRSNTLISEFTEAKANMMNSTFSCSFKSIQEWVRVKSKHPEELKPHEVKTMMSIISEMDKIMRLDKGEPTDIVSETKPISVIEVRNQILKSDPFLKDASFREIENEENTDTD